jgi:hypothetical protein
MSPSPAPAQSYENHVRRIPCLYWAAAGALALNALWSLYLLFRMPSVGTALGCLTALALGVTLLYVRTNSLIVQNRVIRLEERLRLERLLPADLQPRIPELSLAQLVALRFAGDAELAELTRQALDGPITEKDEIKRRVKDWRADWLRV